MAAVVAMDEWPRRSLTVARSTPFSSRRLAWLWRTVGGLLPWATPGPGTSVIQCPRSNPASAGEPSGLTKVGQSAYAEARESRQAWRCQRPLFPCEIGYRGNRAARLRRHARAICDADSPRIGIGPAGRTHSDLPRLPGAAPSGDRFRDGDVGGGGEGLGG